MTVGGTRNKTNSSVKIVKVENVILMRSSTNCSATGCSGYILKISGLGAKVHFCKQCSARKMLGQLVIAR